MKIKLTNTDSIRQILDSKGNDITKKELEKIRNDRHYLLSIDHEYLKAEQDISERIERDRATGNQIKRDAPLPGMQ